MYYKKSLGQHFLKSERALAKIVEAGELKRGETVLEIGPGRGALTERLLAHDLKLIAVEKDDELHEFLKQKFNKEIKEGKLILFHDDILNFEIGSLPALPTGRQVGRQGYKLVANIPYNITGAIFRKFLESDKQPERMVLLVQKEVAERIVAREKKESILSLSVKAYGTPKIIETVKAGSFSPAPKVDSAILLIEGISREFFRNFSEKAFFAMLRAGFKSKRKKLISNLSTLYDKKVLSEVFESLGLDENVRAEDISLSSWQKISQTLK